MDKDDNNEDSCASTGEEDDDVAIPPPPSLVKVTSTQSVVKVSDIYPGLQGDETDYSAFSDITTMTAEEIDNSLFIVDKKTSRAQMMCEYWTNLCNEAMTDFLLKSDYYEYMKSVNPDADETKVAYANVCNTSATYQKTKLEMERYCAKVEANNNGCIQLDNIGKMLGGIRLIESKNTKSENTERITDGGGVGGGDGGGDDLVDTSDEDSIDDILNDTSAESLFTNNTDPLTPTKKANKQANGDSSILLTPSKKVNEKRKTDDGPHDFDHDEEMQKLVTPPKKNKRACFFDCDGKGDLTVCDSCEQHFCNSCHMNFFGTETPSTDGPRRRWKCGNCAIGQLNNR